MPAPDLETIELLPAAVSPRLLFVLLHDPDGSALDMLALGQWLGGAFAQAAVVMVQGLSGPPRAREEPPRRWPRGWRCWRTSCARRCTAQWHCACL